MTTYIPNPTLPDGIDIIMLKDKILYIYDKCGIRYKINIEDSKVNSELNIVKNGLLISPHNETGNCYYTSLLDNTFTLSKVIAIHENKNIDLSDYYLMVDNITALTVAWHKSNKTAMIGYLKHNVLKLSEFILPATYKYNRDVIFPAFGTHNIDDILIYLDEYVYWNDIVFDWGDTPILLWVPPFIFTNHNITNITTNEMKSIDIGSIYIINIANDNIIVTQNQPISGKVSRYVIKFHEWPTFELLYEVKGSLVVAGSDDLLINNDGYIYTSSLDNIELPLFLPTITSNNSLITDVRRKDIINNFIETSNLGMNNNLNKLITEYV